MRRPPMPSNCKPCRKTAGHCPNPTGRGESLAQLIHEYKRDYADHQQAGRDQYRDFANLTDGIRYATGSVGKVPDHQQRVGRRILTQASNRLLQHKDQFKACESFEDLLKLIERYTADIYRFGKLAIYDTACRLGVYLDLAPEVVYLHAGTDKGARALGVDTSRGYLEMNELPDPFRLLEPWECEDFLCIYKARLANLKRRS